MKAVTGLIKTLRPHQWVKNLFVAAPLIFGKKLTDGHAALLALLAVATFCALSGAVYALNDVLDVERDRAHPTKRRRPVASGQLPVRVALAAAVVLAVGALVGASAIRPSFGMVAGAYVAINLLYSFHIKEIPFLDVLTIAAGFLLRVLGGSYAIDVVPSGWLLACTGLLAAFLGFGKRAHELGTLTDAEKENDAGKTRKVLSRYRLHHLYNVLYALAVATSLAYVFYTLSAHTVSFFGTQRMIWTVPFCVFGIGRFVMLVKRHARGDSPTEEILKDWPFLINFVLWGVAVLGIIYYR